MSHHSPCQYLSIYSHIWWQITQFILIMCTAVFTAHAIWSRRLTGCMKWAQVVLWGIYAVISPLEAPDGALAQNSKQMKMLQSNIQPTWLQSFAFPCSPDGTLYILLWSILNLQKDKEITWNMIVPHGSDIPAGYSSENKNNTRDQTSPPLPPL